MNPSHKICPVCENDSLSPEVYTEEIQYNGKVLSVHGLERYVCANCGSDPVLTDQIKRNQVRICDAKRASEGFLTAGEIRSLRERLQLSQPDASTLFGGGANAFSKYERGEVVQSLPMDRLLRAAAELPELVSYLRTLAGLASHADTDQDYTEIENLSLDDPRYTSKRISGRQILVSRCRQVIAPERRKQSSHIHRSKRGAKLAA